MKKFTKNAVGFILLFITVALAVSLSILIYNKIRDKVISSDGVFSAFSFLDEKYL